MDMETIKREGAEIAEALGNGVRYAGPQMVDGKLAYHLFNDDAATDCSFIGHSLAHAKERLTEKRVLCEFPLPIF